MKRRASIFSEKRRFYARYSKRDQNKLDPGPLPISAGGGLWTTTVEETQKAQIKALMGTIKTSRRKAHGYKDRPARARTGRSPSERRTD